MAKWTKLGKTRADIKSKQIFDEFCCLYTPEGIQCTPFSDELGFHY